MTSTLPGADLRGYYNALGIAIPDWATSEAQVRCFADPDAHRNEDRHASMSVNIDDSGAYNCHGCGAQGGAYDAALCRGHDPRSAIELMIAHGLVERRGPDRGAHRSPRTIARRVIGRSPRGAATRRHRLTVNDVQIRAWHTALLARPELVTHLADVRGWSRRAIVELELGLDHQRITIPVRDERQNLVALLRYKTGSSGHKLLAEPGSRRVLYPHPTTIPGRQVVLVEGEPDRIAAHSRGLPAVALPGVDSWQPEWANLLADRDVLIVLDADAAGRKAAHRVEAQLTSTARIVRALDLDARRDDGYDLSDWLEEKPGRGLRLLSQLSELR